MKHVIVAALCAIQVPVVFWLFGYDFNTRDSFAALCYINVLIVFCVAYLFSKGSYL